ncbi:hypothetical protein [Geodermatophilus sp. SYSU D00710]
MSVRRTLTTATATAVAGFTAAFTVAAGPAAAADDPPEQGLVFVAACAHPEFGDGTTDVVAGPTEGFINGWFSGTRGLVTSYIQSQETTVTVQYNDEPPTTLDLSDEYSRPVLDEESGGWITDLVIPLGDLAVGDTVVIGIDVTLKTPVMDFLRGEDGYNVPPRGNLVPPGTQFEGTCTLTVVEG